MGRTRRFFINEDIGYMKATEIELIYGVHRSTVNKRYNRGYRGEDLIIGAFEQLDNVKEDKKGYKVNPGVFSQWGRPDMQEQGQ